MRWMLALLLAVTLSGCLGESKTKLLRNDDKAAFPNIGPVTIGFDNIEDRMVVLLPKTFKTSGVVLDDKTASTISIGLIGRLGINNPYASAARYNPLVVEMDAKSGYYYFIVWRILKIITIIL